MHHFLSTFRRVLLCPPPNKPTNCGATKATVVGNNEIGNDKNEGELLAILM
jgi:hypothetical protein